MPENVSKDYEIRWQNYRAFADTGWVKIRPLTIFIGPNNSGKSSILGPLLLMNQTMSSRDSTTPLVTKGAIIDVGGFADFVHRHRRSAEVSFGLRFHTRESQGVTISKTPFPVGAYPPSQMEIVFAAGAQREQIVLKKNEVFDVLDRPILRRTLRVDGAYGLWMPKHFKIRAEETKSITSSGPIHFGFSPTPALAARSQKMRRRAGRIHSVDIRLSEGFVEYMGATSVVADELRTMFDSLSYIGPLRNKLRRYYELSGEMPSAVGANGEHMASLIRRRGHELRKGLNAWIRRFEFGNSLRADHYANDLFSLTFETIKPKSSTNVADAGFGASQVLPLIVQALAAPKESLTIAEQPEIHLNPRLQSVLADLLVEMAKNDRRVLVETHSEHLLLRLRTLIASGVISPKSVALYFVEKKGGSSTIREIDLRTDGHIPADQWPKGFFEETLKQSIALAVEQSKIKKK